LPHLPVHLFIEKNREREKEREMRKKPRKELRKELRKYMAQNILSRFFSRILWVRWQDLVRNFLVFTPQSHGVYVHYPHDPANGRLITTINPPGVQTNQT